MSGNGFFCRIDRVRCAGKGLASSCQTLLNFFSNLIGGRGLVKQVGGDEERNEEKPWVKKRVKMVDIARAAGVSQTTVSFVLNNIDGMRIADDTRQRVIETARQLGYTPGPMLHDIDSQTPSIVGVLINEISSSYPIDIIDGLHMAARGQAAQLAVFVTDGVTEREAQALQSLRRLGAQSVVYANTFTTGVLPTDELASFPHVFVNCFRTDGKGVAVVPGERAAGFVAAQHLIAGGGKRIAVITGDSWHTSAQRRLNGFRRGITTGGQVLAPELLIHGSWGHGSGYQSMQRLLALPEPPDAVFCHNDMMARGALMAIAEAGLGVPDDIAILGYDDREFAADFGLSTLIQPYADMAVRAMSILRSGRDLSVPATISVRCKLVPRRTTHRVPQGAGSGESALFEDGKASP